MWIIDNHFFTKRRYRNGASIRDCSIHECIKLRKNLDKIPGKFVFALDFSGTVGPTESNILHITSGQELFGTFAKHNDSCEGRTVILHVKITKGLHLLLDSARIGSQHIIRERFREINLTECRDVNIINRCIKTWESVKCQHSACSLFKQQLLISLACNTLSRTGAHPYTPLVANRRELAWLHSHDGDISFR